MKKKLVAVIIIYLAGLHYSCIAQQKSNKSERIITPRVVHNTGNTQPEIAGDETQDSLIKAKLVNLAINSSLIRKADDNIKIAQINLTKSKNAWLSSLSAAGNINEFIINNTVVNGVSAANYYPKYNFGVIIPFDIFSKTKNDKAIAVQNIDIAKSEKEDKIRAVKKEVLTLYENYKEKKELLRLGQISAEGDNESYIAAQKNYTDGTIHLDEMNRAYQTYIATQTKLVTTQRDYNVAMIELEEEIGIPIDDAISQALNPVQDR